MNTIFRTRGEDVDANTTFTIVHQFSTMMYWVKNYDEYGNILNLDPNFYETRYHNNQTGKVYTKLQHEDTVKFYEGEVSYTRWDSEITKPFYTYTI